VSRAVVVATAVAADRNREVLDLAVGDSEDEVFWTQFLRRLRQRGLHGVRLVISDTHAGLKAAITKTRRPDTSRTLRCRSTRHRRPGEEAVR
jgi:putative transposase